MDSYVYYFQIHVSELNIHMINGLTTFTGLSDAGFRGSLFGQKSLYLEKLWCFLESHYYKIVNDRKKVIQDFLNRL